MSEDTTPVAPVSGAHSALRLARENSATSLSDLSQKTRISVKQLEALEAGRYSELPGIAFVKGALRSCAKVLNVDAQPLLDQLQSATGELATPLPVDSGSLSSNGRVGAKVSNRNWLIGSLALGLVAIGYFFANPAQWRAAGSGETKPAATITDASTNATTNATATAGLAVVPTQELSPTGPSLQASQSGAATPVPATSPATSPATAATAVAQAPPLTAVAAQAEAKSVIEMQFARDSWVEVRQADGKIINNQLHKAGTKAAMDAQGPVALIIGGAAGVSVNWQGQPQDLKPHTRDDVARVTLK